MFPPVKNLSIKNKSRRVQNAGCGQLSPDMVERIGLVYCEGVKAVGLIHVCGRRQRRASLHTTRLISEFLRTVV